MSAFLVSREHIHVLVHAALHGSWNLKRGSEFSIYTSGGTRYVFTFEDENCLGQILETENLRSVNFRYQTADAIEVPYEYKTPRGQHTPIQLIKAIHCYEYQACECNDWKDTVAYAFCHTLEQKLIQQLPGYDAAPWGIEP